MVKYDLISVSIKRLKYVTIIYFFQSKHAAVLAAKGNNTV